MEHGDDGCIFHEGYNVKKIEMKYDEKRNLATCMIAGRTVTFRGSREAAERFFSGLADRVDPRGLVYAPLGAMDVATGRLR